MLRPSPAPEDAGPSFFRTPFGVEEDDVAKAGWGIVFRRGHGDDVRAALQPLVDHRAKTVRADRLKKLGYQKGDDARAFLARYGVSTANVAPTKVPYYLLLVGSPRSIPFEVERLLAVQYIVGRVAFTAADEYARYRGVRRRLRDRPRLLGPAGGRLPGGTAHDDATRLSKDGLLVVHRSRKDGRGGDGPSRRTRSASRRKSFLVADATKANLVSLLRDGPAVLFNGVARRLPSSRVTRFQARAQGALLCQDIASAPAPRGHGDGNVDPALYFAADDVPDDARVHGLVAVAFALLQRRHAGRGARSARASRARPSWPASRSASSPIRTAARWP